MMELLRPPLKTKPPWRNPWGLFSFKISSLNNTSMKNCISCNAKFEGQARFCSECLDYVMNYEEVPEPAVVHVVSVHHTGGSHCEAIEPIYSVATLEDPSELIEKLDLATSSRNELYVWHQKFSTVSLKEAIAMADSFIKDWDL